MGIIKHNATISSHNKTIFPSLQKVEKNYHKEIWGVTFNICSHRNYCI